MISRIDHGRCYQLNLCIRLHAQVNSTAPAIFGAAVRSTATRLRRLGHWPEEWQTPADDHEFQPRALLADSGPHRADGADQGHRTPQSRRRWRSGTARFRQGRGRKRHDRRPDAQRSIAGLPTRHRCCPGSAGDPAASGRLAPGVGGSRRAGAGGNHCAGACGGLPARIGDRSSQNLRAARDRRSRGRTAARVHRAASAWSVPWPVPTST